MSQAKCFNCNRIMEGVGKPMEEIKLPIFCSLECSEAYPIPEDQE